MKINRINVHAGFPTLLSNEEFLSIAQKSKGNDERFRVNLRAALHARLNHPEMRERRFTLCFYVLPFAYTRPGTNGINTSNSVKGNTIMGKPNNKPNRDNKAQKPALTVDAVKAAILAHPHAVAEAELEDTAYTVLTRITKRHMSMEQALDDVLLPKTQDHVEVELDLDSLPEATRAGIAEQVVALRQADSTLTQEDAVNTVLVNAIETKVNQEEVTMQNTNTNNAETLNPTDAEDVVEVEQEVSLDEQRAAEEAYVAEHGSELNVSKEGGINWKVVGGVAGGLAVAGLIGYFGYRYWQGRQENLTVNATVSDTDEI